MPDFSQLRRAGMVRAPDGFRACQFHELPAMTIEETIEAVEAAGGRVVINQIPSEGLRPGRVFARFRRAAYFLLPSGAFDRQS